MKITKSKEWYYWARIITYASAWVFCIVPTFVVGLIKLPVIAPSNGSADSTLTGAFTFVLICCVYPIFKGLLRILKSPSAWLIMWLMALVTLALYRLSHETLGAFVVVFFTAAIGNSIGAILFALSKNFNEKWKYCGQIKIT